MQPKISVVIAVYNRAEFLKETICSLQSQTLQEWEAIIVDDYSTEDIQAVVAEFADERLMYIQNTGSKGPSAARNLGNRNARAELIAVADSDDIILPRRLEIAVKHFELHPETDLFYTRMYSFQDGTNKYKDYKYFLAYNREALYTRDFIPHVTVVYTKARILELPYDESLHAAIDYDMVLNFANRNLKFAFSDEPTVLYRRHTEQISADGSERKQLQAKNTAVILEKHRHYLLNPITV